jgi:hypothetical protein
MITTDLALCQDFSIAMCDVLFDNYDSLWTELQVGWGYIVC